MRSFLRIFLRASALVRARKQRLEIGRERAAEKPKLAARWCGNSANGLVVPPQVSGWLRSMMRSARPARRASTARRCLGVDGCGDVAPPQRHVEIGVLAAEELDHGRSRQARRRAERPQEQRRRRAASKPTTMKGVMPASAPTWRCQELKKIVALIGRAPAPAHAPAPANAARPLAMSSKTSTRAMRPVSRRQRPCSAVSGARRRRSWRGPANR